MLILKNLTRTFGNITAVDHLNLSIEPGSFVGVIGRSGAGKSTLLRMINRLEEPSSGSIEFGDIRVTSLSGPQVRQWRRECAMVFQQFNLIGRMDVLTNVLMGRLTSVSNWRSLLQWWKDEDRIRALAALERFDMGEFASRRCDQLSGGQQQRVAICRALVQEPKIILADEPIASLDPRNSTTVMDALRTINQDLGITVICNLHSLDVARDYCSRLIGLSSGQVVFDGEPDALTDVLVTRLYGLGASQIDDSFEVTAKPAAVAELEVA
jgi:phosphonate transport system ATP-binding protein